MSLRSQSLIAFGLGSPWLLGGLLLAGLPILIHLLNRRRHRDERWAAMQFLAEALRKHSRRIRIEQLVLLAVRTAVLVVFVLAFARPYFEGPGGRGPTGRPTRYMLVIDASMSMAHRPAEFSRFERARQAARQLVQASRTGDAFELLAIRGTQPPAVIRQAARRRQDVLDELERLERTDEPGDLVAALEEAVRLVSQDNGDRRRVVTIFSDLQRGTWQPESAARRGRLRDALEQLDKHAEVTVVDVGGESVGNTAVVSVRSVEPVVTVTRPVRIQATLRHFGTSAPPERVVELYVDGKLAGRKRVTMLPGREVPVEFTHAIRVGGEHHIEVRAEADSLIDDDTRWLALPVRRQLAVLLVNGRYAARAADAATYFVERALSPGREKQSTADRVVSVVVDERDLATEDLGRYDCVLLCNLARPDPATATMLDKFVSAGGGLVIALGDQVDPDGYNRLADLAGAGLLPARLGAVIDASGAADSVFRFDPGDHSHPLLSAFRGVAGSGLASTLTFRYVRAQPADGTTRVALRFDSGDPAIITARHGRGRVVLVTTSLDDRWGTWPVLSPSFLPMVHELVLFSISGRWEQRQRLVGEPLVRPITVPAVDITGQVTKPDGGRQPLSRPPRDPDAGLVFSDTLKRGVYRISIGPPVNASEIYAVNVDPIESDLAAVPAGELATGLLAGLTIDVVSESAPTETRSTTSVASREPVSGRLLAAALALLLVEQLMAWQFFAGLVALIAVAAGAMAAMFAGWPGAAAATGIVVATGWWQRRRRREKPRLRLTEPLHWRITAAPISPGPHGAPGSLARTESPTGVIPEHRGADTVVSSRVLFDCLLTGQRPMSTTRKRRTGQASLTGADVMIEAVLRQGVDCIFAYPGGASMPLHQSLIAHSDRLRTILPRHEQGGGFAAQGYARSTGRIGVCMATSGPGATNLVTSLADAKMDSVPIVAITGQVPKQVIGTDAFQETPIVEVCRAVTKHHYLITELDEVTRVVKEAFHIARTGRPGPVLIDFPKDIQLLTPGDPPDYDPPMNLPGYHPERLQARPEQIRQLVAAIRRARRPVLYVGGGCINSNAAEALREFAERTRIPVTMTLMGLGAFPGDHPRSLGMLGMHGTVTSNYAVNEADLLLAFGVRFDDRVTGKLEEFAKHGKIVHVDIDPSEIHKNKEAHLAIIADLGDVLEQLNQALTDDDLPQVDDWLEQTRAWKQEFPLTFQDDDKWIYPQYAIGELCRQSRDRETFVTVGVGQHQMWAAQYFTFDQPRHWMSSSGLGTMGFGLPAAMGAQAAHPDALVVDIDGDGSLLMNLQELATLHCEKLPVKVLLLNNQHLGMVMQWEDRFYEGRRAHTWLGPVDAPEASGEGDGRLATTYPDFVSIAHGFGVEAEQVRDRADFPDALARMLDAKGAFLLDVICPYQEHVLPMIPSGHTVRDIITE